MDVANNDSCHDSCIVTEDDIAASLLLKEETSEVDNDSVSLVGSCVSIGTLSGLSTCSAYSLNALKQRKNQLIESIKSQLNSSHIGDELATPNTSFSIDDHPFTSTPYQENVPPAAKLLTDWRYFSNIEEIVDKDDSSEQPVRYEEAFESLKEILGESEDLLGTYESALEVYKQNEDKKLEEIMSFFEERKETSSASDNTVIDLVMKLDDDKPKDDNDNTIITINSSITSVSEAEITVIENKVTEKTGKDLNLNDPENVIIAAEEDVNADLTLVNEEDEERLLASDNDEEQPPASVAAITEVKEKAWAEFVSNDPDENRDNNDPQWERLRNLGSDYERYLAVRQRWRNMDIPNPKKDLTCRCRRITVNNVEMNFRSLPPPSETQSRKRPHSLDANTNDNKKSKVESCTMLFDRGIEMVLTDLEYQKKKLDQEQKRSLNQLADTQRLEQIAAAYHRRVPDQEMRAMKEKHFKETFDLVRNFSNRRELLMTTSKQQIGALRQAAAEVREFHEFYPVTEGPEGRTEMNSLTYLSAIEVEEILEIESMFMQFEQFYARPRGYDQQ